MKYIALKNFNAGEGPVKIGDEYSGSQGPALVAKGLLECLETGKVELEEPEIKPEKKRKSKKKG